MPEPRRCAGDWAHPARIVRQVRREVVRILDGWPAEAEILAASAHRTRTSNSTVSTVERSTPSVRKRSSESSAASCVASGGRNEFLTSCSYGERSSHRRTSGRNSGPSTSDSPGSRCCKWRGAGRKGARLEPLLCADGAHSGGRYLEGSPRHGGARSTADTGILCRGPRGHLGVVDLVRWQT